MDDRIGRELPHDGAHSGASSRSISRNVTPDGTISGHRLEVATTSCPELTSAGSSGLPTAPVAPNHEHSHGFSLHSGSYAA
jgi:hypothetical protein